MLVVGTTASVINVGITTMRCILQCATLTSSIKADVFLCDGLTSLYRRSYKLLRPTYLRYSESTLHTELHTTLHCYWQIIRMLIEVMTLYADEDGVKLEQVFTFFLLLLAIYCKCVVDINTKAKIRLSVAFYLNTFFKLIIQLRNFVPIRKELKLKGQRK